MPPKPDPYATKSQKRIDALLFIFTVLVIALFLCDSARGQGTFIAAAPRPVWSTLSFFPAEPRVSMMLVAPNFLIQGEPDDAALNATDVSALTGLLGNSKLGFARLTNWSNDAGVSSIIPSYSAGFGTPPDSLSAVATKSSQTQAIAWPIDEGPHYARESKIPSVTSSAPTSVFANSITDSTSQIIRTLSAGSDKSASTMSTLGGLTAPDAITGSGKDFFQNTAMTSSTNYDPTGLPSNTDDVRLTTGGTGLTITSADITMESLSALNGMSYSISNATTTATNSTLTLGNSAGFTNVWSGTANDLIFLSGNSSLTILGPNSSSGTGTLGLVLASSGNFNVETGSSLTISSVISGSGFSLTKTGGGTTTLSGANTFTGGVTLEAGRLNINSASALGTTAGTFVINGGTIDNTSGAAITTANYAQIWNGDFTFTGATGATHNLNLGTGAVSLGTAPGTSRTITTYGNDLSKFTIGGVISDGTTANSLTKDGTGVLILTGANTYTGGTIVSDGTLQLVGSGKLGSTTGSLTINGGTVDLQGTFQTIGALNGSNPSGLVEGFLGTGELTVGNGDASGDYSGVIVLHSLAKIGNGTQTLSGSGSEFGLNIHGGVLALGSDGAIGNTRTITFSGGTLQYSALNTRDYSSRFSPSSFQIYRVDSNGQNIDPFNSSLTSNAGTFTKLGAGTITLAANNTYSGTTTISGGTLQVGAGGTTGTLGTGAVIDNATLAFNRSNAMTVANNISGSGAVTQIGGGTTTLSGTNSYAGATTVNAGTLLIDGNQSAATGAVSVNNTGTLLGGTGTIGGAVTVNQGASITGATNGTVGTLTLMSTATFAGASGSLATFVIDLLGATSDRLAISGVLDLSNLFDSLSFSGFADGTTTYVLATFSSVTGVFNDIANLPSGYGLFYNANNLELSPMTPVPEPGTWLAGALALLALSCTQLRKRAARQMTAESSRLPRSAFSESSPLIST